MLLFLEVIRMKECIAIIVKALDLHIYFVDGELRIEAKVSRLRLCDLEKENVLRRG